MKSDARAVLERIRVGQQLEHRVREARLRGRVRRRQILAAADLLDIHAGQVHGRTLAGQRGVLPLAVHLHPAHLHAPVSRQHHQLVVHAYRSGHERAGYDRAESFHREDPIDRQAGGALRRSPFHSRRCRDERGAKCVQSVARLRGDGHHGSALEE